MNYLALSKDNNLWYKIACFLKIEEEIDGEIEHKAQNFIWYA